MVSDRNDDEIESRTPGLGSLPKQPVSRGLVAPWAADLVGESDALFEVLRAIAKVAPTRATVLLQGEACANCCTGL